MQVGKAYEEVYEGLCEEAWRQLHRVAVTIGVSVEEPLVDNLREIFDEVMVPLGDKYLE